MKGQTKRERDAAYYLENRDAIIARVTRYQRKNITKVRSWKSKHQKSSKSKAKRAARYVNLRDQIKQKSAEWAKANPGKRKAICQRWYDRHPDRARQVASQSRRRNPSTGRLRSARRRARKRAAMIGDQQTIRIWETTWRKQRRVRCFWCDNEFASSDCHSDHIIPLARGGAHSIENLCISCEGCNCSKSAKSIEDWNSQLLSPVLL